MTNPLKEKLKRLINYEIKEDNFEFRKWFLKLFEANDESYCSLEEFAVYFVNTLKEITDVHIRTWNTEGPKPQTGVNINVEKVCTPTKQQENCNPFDSPYPYTKNDNSKDNSNIEFESASPSGTSPAANRLNFSHNEMTSTPIRRNILKNSRKLLPTPGSANKSATSSLSLGDFLVDNTPTVSRSNKKKTTPTSNQQASQKSQPDKPKKRVQPISISKKVKKNIYNSKPSIFAGESSFSNENNILKITNTELEDKGQCAILAARKSLAKNTSEITEEIRNVSILRISAAPAAVKQMDTMDISLDLKKLENNLSLKRLAHIYTLIIDLNLTTNILNELSFLLNLLNAPNTNKLLKATCNDIEQLHLHDDIGSQEKSLTMLEDFSKAVYFAVLCLEHEKRSLASLDAKSLGVVVISERFSCLSDNVRMYLFQIYQLKLQLATAKPFSDPSSLYFDPKACNNVHFQHEQDSRENFTSQQEFTYFRAQRDLFYDCLKIWETNHLNPAWKFSVEITPQIKEIFTISENCINMAHLAKLFVSQLLLSASNATSPAEIGLDVDVLKFSKLTQRLITPSQFSVDYQFPRTEGFFRDFILKARSLAFAEQLKMELYNQLITQNDSSLDHINMSKDENDVGEEKPSSVDGSQSFIVKTDILNSMLILAKFLGFTISLPYNINNCNTIPAEIGKNQMKLRLLMQPTFDVCALLEQALMQSKLLIAVPWLIQYFAMLDDITLQLENYMKTLKLLFAVYYQLGSENLSTFCPTSVFIIKLSLGWLFESKQFIAEAYYNYRAMLKEKNSQDSKIEFDFVKSKLKCNILRCKDSEGITLNPYLETLMPIACPFLSEFRVSIMPAKCAQIKNASRTGSYRHITTRIAQLNNSAAIIDKSSTNLHKRQPNQVQNSLIQAFLHSQNSSTRQVIKFCTERCYKSTVKDGQIKILLPAKSNADNMVNQITANKLRFVYESIKTIYADTQARVKEEWKEFIPRVLHKRINNALESLLPEETSSILKRTYFMIIEKEAAIKISQWFYTNIIFDNYFCQNLEEMAHKISCANMQKVPLDANQLFLIKQTPTVSDLIDELQYWLHCTSVRLDRFEDPQPPLVNLFKNFIISFENGLPPFLYHLLGAGIIQLLRNIIANCCTSLSNELLEVVYEVLLHRNMIKALSSLSKNNICIYDAFITKTFIESLGNKTESFNRLASLIIAMIKKEIITMNYVNELFVSLFKHEWHPLVLIEISLMLKTIAKETSDMPQKRLCNSEGESENHAGHDDDDNDDGKSNLFMDMLADISRDVDIF